MIENDLTALGQQIAQLRISKQLKQTELAYEAGVSHRTLQRLEAGEAVRSDGLLRVIRTLERLDEVMSALDTGLFSPYEMLSDSGLTLSQLQNQKAIADKNASMDVGGSTQRTRKKRVRKTAAQEAPKHSRATVQWPEDQ